MRPAPGIGRRPMTPAGGDRLFLPTVRRCHCAPGGVAAPCCRCSAGLRASSDTDTSAEESESLQQFSTPIGLHTSQRRCRDTPVDVASGTVGGTGLLAILLELSRRLLILQRILPRVVPASRAAFIPPSPRPGLTPLTSTHHLMPASLPSVVLMNPPFWQRFMSDRQMADCSVTATSDRSWTSPRRTARHPHRCERRARTIPHDGIVHPLAQQEVASLLRRPLTALSMPSTHQYRHSASPSSIDISAQRRRVIRFPRHCSTTCRLLVG